MENIPRKPEDPSMKILGRTYRLGLEEVKTLQFWRGILGEYLATMFFLLTCLIGVWSSDNLVAGAFGTGLAIAVLVQIFDAVSGGAINPSVSLALLLNGQVSLLTCIMHIIAQLSGAVSGAGIVKLTTLDSAVDSILEPMAGSDVFDSCIPSLRDGFEWQGCLLEFLFTSILVVQVLRCTDTVKPVENGNIALSIGLVVVVANFCLIPITGGPVNPARYLGPAFVGNKLDHVGYYVLAHAVAAVITPFIYCPLLHEVHDDDEDRKELEMQLSPSIH